MTHTAFRTAAIAVLAFGLGLGAARIVAPARAAAAPLQPAILDLSALGPADLPTPSPASPNNRSKTLVLADGATVAIQIGTVAKHYHAEANEIQYVVDGTGTEWLGDKDYPVKPGTLLIIPKGTPHAGTTQTSGHLKILAIKTPPQDPADVHPVP
jgi:mannose-6-phosphate isomerase-like protein (cupin superfamily)